MVYKTFSDKESQHKELRDPIRKLLMSYFTINYWLFNAKSIIVAEEQWYYFTHNWGYKVIHILSQGFSPKVNVKSWLEFELADFRPQFSTLAIWPQELPPPKKNVEVMKKVVILSQCQKN